MPKRSGAETYVAELDPVRVEFVETDASLVIWSWRFSPTVGRSTLTVMLYCSRILHGVMSLDYPSRSGFWIMAQTLGFQRRKVQE